MTAWIDQNRAQSCLFFPTETLGKGVGYSQSQILTRVAQDKRDTGLTLSLVRGGLVSYAADTDLKCNII